MPSNDACEFCIIIGFISFIVVIIAVLYPRSPASCDMSKAENRDFDVYYGIKGLESPFARTTADDCKTNIIFTPALPQKVLTADKSASSFMILAKYGTGKTLLRCEYFKTLNSDHYFKILILNKQINEYLERFITSKKLNLKDCVNDDCLTDWSGDELAQLMLSVLVTKFIENNSQKEINKLTNIPIEEKMNLITIICYYYNGDRIRLLEDFVNVIFEKSEKSLYKASDAQVKIDGRYLYRDGALLDYLQTDFNQFSILNKNIEKLHLLSVIIHGEDFRRQSMQKTMFGHVVRDLTDFSSFIKKYMGKRIVFIFDGIDENEYFFQNNKVNKITLESFCRSTVSEKILSFTMAGSFDLSLFYPELDGINIGNVARPDKFPTYTLTWNSKSLINYADHVLQELNKNASSTRCEPFIDFKTLVNYKNQEMAKIINQIQTPRDLHYFLIDLIQHMNDDAKNVKSPFKATFENGQDAFENGRKYRRITI